jgi:hypothetical protein
MLNSLIIATQGYPFSITLVFNIFLGENPVTNIVPRTTNAEPINVLMPMSSFRNICPQRMPNTGI